MKRSNRRWWIFGAIALGAIVLLTVLAAPAGDRLSRGSTYSRAPDGYGAWYEFMGDRGTPVRRWEKPPEDGFAALSADAPGVPDAPAVLLQVLPIAQSPGVYGPERDWVAAGNHLVRLGVRQPATAAPFRTEQDSAAGPVTVATTRRKTDPEGQRLGDRYGSTVWQEAIGAGSAVYATPADLAANAYQNAPGNFEFLANLLEELAGGEGGDAAPAALRDRLWVDEYLHGHRDAETQAAERRANPFGYLADTPWALLLAQGAIVLAIAVVAANRRFGPPVPVPRPEIDNSEAYMRALAAVLEKAEAGEFAVAAIGRAERLRLQAALGLGREPADRATLLETWTARTGRSPDELAALLDREQRWTEGEDSGSGQTSAGKFGAGKSGAGKSGAGKSGAGKSGAGKSRRRDRRRPSDADLLDWTEGWARLWRSADPPGDSSLETLGDRGVSLGNPRR